MARVSSARREMAALAVDPLLEALEDREEAVRHAAVRALADIGFAANAAAAAVAALAEDSSPKVRRGAARALGRVAAPEQAAAALSALLADDETTVRWTAARALAGYGAAAFDRLAGALEDPNPAVRAAAAVGLGEMGGGEQADAAALLEGARRDGDDSVRAAADSALARIAALAARR